MLHPDKNKENGKLAVATFAFSEICEAYEVLSNKEKRQTYDQFGKSGLNSSGMGSGGGFSSEQAEVRVPDIEGMMLWPCCMQTHRSRGLSTTATRSQSRAGVCAARLLRAATGRN